MQSRYRIDGLNRRDLVAGRFIFLVIIIVAACVVPAVTFCTDCNSTAVADCQGQGLIVNHFSCTPGVCAGDGTCEYACGTGMMEMPEMQPMPEMPQMPQMPPMGG